MLRIFQILSIASMILLMIACSIIPQESINSVNKEVASIERLDNEVTLALISPSGHYLPFAKYEVELNGDLYELGVASYRYINIRAAENLTVRYRYNEGFDRAIGEWREAEVELNDRMTFLFFADHHLNILDSHSGIQEIARLK